MACEKVSHYQHITHTVKNLVNENKELSQDLCNFSVTKHYGTGYTSFSKRLTQTKRVRQKDKKAGRNDKADKLKRGQ